MTIQERIHNLGNWLNTQIIGQSTLVNRLLIALLADGHLLVEGAPGLAKTKAIKALADGIQGDFHRIQFTPDLLPGDITGTDIYRPETGTFQFQQGPIFNHLILADEINRAPAKVQSALLEAMAERQVSVGRTTYALPALFMVMATQNPIEQEGTYTLPEAQLDRFLLHVNVDFPDAISEMAILKLARGEMFDKQEKHTPVQFTPVTEETIFVARTQVQTLYTSPAIDEYIVQLVMATRSRKDPQLATWLTSGVSPRATIALDRCARAQAWLQGRDYVSPDDVQSIVYDVLRHRLLLSFNAQADGITPKDVIKHILAITPIA